MATGVSMTTFLENKLLDLIFNTVDFNPASIFSALYTVAPGEGAGGTEVANAGAYARIDITTKFAAASGGIVSNDVLIDHGTATANWGTLVAAAVIDSGTYGAGNMYLYGNLTANQTVNNGGQFQFAVGDYSCEFD